MRVSWRPLATAGAPGDRCALATAGDLATTGDLATGGDRIVARPSNQWGRGCYTVQMCVHTTKVVRGIPK
eukprot:1848271-Prymnesium_polylepis.1